MCKESKRLTPFRPKKLSKKKKAEMQAGVFATFRNDLRELNAAGLARYEAMRKSGAWEHQNYEENFGECSEQA